MTQSGHISSESIPRTSPGQWVASILIGLGIWLMFDGIDAIPRSLLWISCIFILVGGFYLVLEGIRNFNQPEFFLSGVIKPIVFGLGLAVSLVLVEHFLHYLGFPYPLDDGEGFVLNQAILAAKGLPLYQPINQPPYIVTNYPPVYPYVLSAFVDPENPQMFTGQLISVLSTLILCVSGAGIVRFASGNKYAGWVAGLLIAASPVVYFWGALLRVDMLASALTLAGLWLAVKSFGPYRNLSVLILVLALFTRQSSVEGLCAVLAWLWFSSSDTGESRKSALIETAKYFFAWLLISAAAFIYLQISSDGEIYKHIVTYTRTNFYPSRVYFALQWIVPSHGILFLLALLALPEAVGDRRRIPLAVFFVISLCTALLSGKVGSDLNYFINLIAASACLAGCFTADLIESILKNGGQSGIKLLAIILIPAAIAQSGLLEGDRQLSFTPQKEDYVEGARIVHILQQPNGIILSEDEGFCLLSGKEVLFNAFIMSELAREGIWDQTDFIHAIQSQAFGVIILRFYVDDPFHDDRPGAGGNAGWDRFTEEMEAAISQYYEVDMAVSPIFMRRWWYIYRPKVIPAELEGESITPETIRKSLLEDEPAPNEE